MKSQFLLPPVSTKCAIAVIAVAFGMAPAAAQVPKLEYAKESGVSYMKSGGLMESPIGGMGGMGGGFR